MKEAIKTRLNNLLAFLRKQMQEASTIRGIIVGLGGLGALGGIEPEVIVPFALVLSAAVAILLPDKLQ